jgi:hypothetical protein
MTMTPIPPVAPPAVAVTAEPAEFPLSLSEFCSRLSATDKRVELISAFHHDETAAGRSRDGEAAYRARFDAFVHRPA